jgi:hypothetical protein
LNAARLNLTQVTDALIKTNLVLPTGMHEENHTLYLAVVSGRVHDMDEIANFFFRLACGRIDNQRADDALKAAIALRSCCGC